MWTCQQCGASVDDRYQVCSYCGADGANLDDADFRSAPQPAQPAPQFDDPYRPSDYQPEPDASGGKGGAFVKGGCGCLGAFLVLGLLGVMLGGRMHIDIGGALCLFVVGGLIGLAVLAIYNKGAREARRNDRR